MKITLLYPALNGTDINTIRPLIEQLDPLVQGYHIDVMDGIFVQNLTWGVAGVNLLASQSMRTSSWVHLMVEDVALYVASLLLAPGSLVSFHLESGAEVEAIIKILKEKKYKTSLAINPKTNVEKTFPYAHLVDQILLMSVEPGHSGQDFLPEAIKKVELLAAYRATSKLNFRIGIDGGIDAENIAMLAEKGVDDFAIGSAIFASPDPVEAITILRKQLDTK